MGSSYPDKKETMKRGRVSAQENWEPEDILKGKEN